MSNKSVVANLVAELVVAQVLGPCQQSEGAWFNKGIPVPCLAADRAIALVCARVEIDVRLELDCAAVTAAFVHLQHPMSLQRIGEVYRGSVLREA